MGADQATLDLNIATARRLIEDGFSRGIVDVCDEVVACDAVEHQRGLRSGPEGAKEAIRTLHAWFSEFELAIEEVVADGDRVWVRSTGRGLNTGSVFGRPATGQGFEITVFDELRLRDGRVIEHWGVPDQLGMLMQLGLFGRPEPARVAG